MPVTLADNEYGKSRIRLAKVTRHGDHHDFKDLTVGVHLRGDFEAAHLEGNNRLILPTDTMKNTVYALAKDHPLEQIEDFALHLASYFLTNNPQVTDVRIEIAEHPWSRYQRYSFVKGSGERRLTWITANRAGVSIESGIGDLTVLKTTGSGFVGYIKDRFTTLKETTDRIFATVIQARWRYRDRDVPFNTCWQGVRQTILDTFAEHDSLSVQQTAYETGRQALENFEQIEQIHLSLPNRHHLLMDLSPFGMENPNEIFIPTEEPHGLIEVTCHRPSACASPSPEPG
jgi:urate oxidase